MAPVGRTRGRQKKNRQRAGGFFRETFCTESVQNAPATACALRPVKIKVAVGGAAVHAGAVLAQRRNNPQSPRAQDVSWSKNAHSNEGCAIRRIFRRSKPRCHRLYTELCTGSVDKRGPRYGDSPPGRVGDFFRKGRRTVSGSDADGPAPGAPVSPEEQARQGTEVSYATAKLRADVARQQMRLAKDQLKRARKRFKEARREARRARKLADIARRAWKKAKRRKRKEGDPAALETPPTTGGWMETGARVTRADEGSSKKSAGHRAGGKRGSNGKKQNPVGRLAKTRKAGAGARRAR